MPTHPGASLDLGLLDAAIANRKLRLTFEPKLEALYEAKLVGWRLRHFKTTALVALVLYDLFLLNDWLLLPDRVLTLAVLRLCIFSPVLLLLLWVNERWPSLVLREWSAVGGAALGVLLPMAAMVTSASPDKLIYQSSSLLVMMFATMVQRVRFKQATAGLALMLAIQLAANGLSFDARTFLATAAFYITTSILLLLAVHFTERADRRAFLFAQRGRLLQEELQALARRDALTGLFNRRHLDEVADELWADPETDRVAAILIDIDHFKLFNDSYGHIAGDECLRTLSARVVAHAPGGLAFRFGGEEMLVLLPGAEVAEAVATAETIRRSIAAAAVPHPALGGLAVISASFGVASLPTGETAMIDLVAAADRALYAAKRAGRNCVHPLDWRRRTRVEARRSA